MAQIPQRGGVRSYRDPQRPGIRMLQTDGLTRPSEQYAAIMLAKAEAEGRPITPEFVAKVEELASEAEVRMMAEIRARGIPEGIRQLLRAKKKKQVRKALREIVLSEKDLHDFTCNCAVVGLSHWDKFLEFVPEQRRPDEEDRRALIELPRESPEHAEAWKKLQQLYIEREHRSVHLFADSRERWHCFFMTLRDVAGDPESDKHHWQHGAHLHYVGHLSDERLTKEAVWKQLDERHHNLPTEHVRFRVEGARPMRLNTFVDPRTGLAAVRDRVPPS